MPKPSFHLSALLLLALLGQPAAFAAPQPTLSCWALIATDEVVETGLLDLLTVELSRHKSVQLVERESSRAATRELQLTALVKADQVSQRLQLGKTLRANALMVLSVESHQGRRLLRVVVCDADFGVRLWRGGFTFGDKSEVEQLVPHCVTTVDEVRQRFADGIRHVIAVPPFLSEDFGVRFDYLQTRCRELLSSSLMSHAGVAVVEIDEARAVLREWETTLSGGLERPIATVVKATYTVTPPDDQRRRFVQLKLELAHGDDRRERLEKQLALGALDAWLLTEFTPHLLAAGQRRGPELSAKAQKEILCRHAQQFAQLGNWEQSISLREAALILDPNDALQRALAISEYQHRNRPDPDRIWQLSQAFKQLSQDQRENEFRRAANDYRVGFDHLAYLIRNRLIGRVDAIGMFGKHAWYESHAMRVAMHNDPLKVELIQPACIAQREFIRDVYPQVGELPNRRTLPKHLSEPYYGGRYELTQHVAEDVMFNKFDAGSVASLGDVLLRQLPADDITSDRILGLLSYPYVPQPGDDRFAAWNGLITDLSQSDRELARLYGQFAKAEAQQRRDRSVAPFEALLAEVTRLGRGDQAITKLIQLRLGRPAPQPRVASAARSPRGNFGPLGRMRFEPVPVIVEGEPAAGPPRILGMLGCGDRDVYWTKDRFFVMNEPGVLREWKLTEATARHELFWEIAWDGECLWLHAHGQGIIVVRSDGTRLASFRDKIPGYWKGHRLIGLSPRRAMMVGCLGDTERAWCGLLEVDEAGRPSANVFFEAKNVAEGRTREQASADVTTAFRPDELSRLRHADGREFVLVERHGLSPLLIDSKTLKAATVDQADGLNGLSTVTEFGFTGGRFLRDVQPVLVHSGVATTPNSKRLVFDDGWLYRPGSVWTRQHTATRRLERLQANSLPPTYWNLRAGSSVHYGLIAFDPADDTRPLIRITIENERGRNDAAD